MSHAATINHRKHHARKHHATNLIGMPPGVSSKNIPSTTLIRRFSIFSHKAWNHEFLVVRGRMGERAEEERSARVRIGQDRQRLADAECV